MGNKLWLKLLNINDITIETFLLKRLDVLSIKAETYLRKNNYQINFHVH